MHDKIAGRIAELEAENERLSATCVERLARIMALEKELRLRREGEARLRDALAWEIRGDCSHRFPGPACDECIEAALKALLARADSNHKLATNSGGKP